MTGREVEVEVRRLQPLSLVFRLHGSQEIAPIIVEALERLTDEKFGLVTTGKT